MTKTKKASLSLSINAIVVLILAIAMLGLALGFIKTMFGKVSGQVEAVVATEAEPRLASASEPLTLSKDTFVLRPGETTGLKFSAYNAGSEEFEKKTGRTPVVDAADILSAQATPATGKCLVSSTGTPTKDAPLKVKSQIKKKIKQGESIISQAVIQAFTSPADTLCQICTVELGGDSGTTPPKTGESGCADVRVIIR